MIHPVLFTFIEEHKPLPKGVVCVLITEKKETVFVRLPSGSCNLEIGIGDYNQITLRQMRLIIRKIIQVAKIHRITSIAIKYSDLCFKNIPYSEEIVAELIAVNMEMANFEFVNYKTKPKEGWQAVKKVYVIGRLTKTVKNAFKKGSTIGIEVNASRSLSNTPGGEMTPRLLADEAKKAVRGTSVKVTVLDEKNITYLKMGGLLGVSRGSSEKPCFVVLEYKPKKIASKPIVLIGKGVTFDTGGLNLKPGDSMYEMHMDMSGGSAVIHAIVAAAKLKLNCHIVALIPAVENMPSGTGYRPGDILTSMSGRTIEVLNTDAEGRIILADALTYALRYKPALVIDIATLTGAALTALGTRCSALFASDEHTERFIRTQGEKSGDYVWPLPLWDEYDDDIKGTFGDIANMGKNRYGGAIMAAKFLHTFAKDLMCPWAHIDIVPRMTSTEGDLLAKGSSGEPVRLLVAVMETYTQT